MKVLVLGGTHFVGRHIVEAFLNAGHQVSIFTRGVSPDPLPAQVERLQGDRDLGKSGLQSLVGRKWDACVDVSGYTAVQVRSSAETLSEHVGWYVYVSAVSVYGDPDLCPVLETHSLLPPAPEHTTEVDGETYGPLKVTCENIVQEVFPGRCTLLRPQVVVGPHDPSNRYTHWVNRAAREGEMLAPGDGNDFLQVVDVRDLARFTVRAAEQGLAGPFNLAGPRITWRQFMDMLGASQPVWVPATFLQQAGLTFVELPLYRLAGGPRSSLMHVGVDRAKAVGFTWTNPLVTLHDIQEWSKQNPLPLALSADREQALIEQARQRQTRGNVP